MTKQVKGSNSDDRGEIEFQFVNVKLKGSARTLEHTMQAVVATLRQSAAGGAVQNNGTAKPVLAPHESAQAEDATDPEIDADDSDDETGEASTSDAALPSRRRAPRKGPTFKTLNWDGPPAWKDLVAKYSPKGQWDRLMLITHWCKKVGIAEVGAEELFSAWKSANWNMSDAPSDWLQPLRDMKSQRQFFTKGAVKSTYAINELGDKHVEEMKPGDDA